ncbi:MAG: phosphoglycerate mutase family protein [Microthrixaceae bacterium]
MTLYLVRHGKAGTRDSSDPLDFQRQLDHKGRRQAIWVADQLIDCKLGAVWSSPLPRCSQTVEPTALRHGLSVDPVEALAEGSALDRAWAVVEDAMALASDVVLCSHGDLIPDLVRRAQGRGMVVPGRRGFDKGSIWALTVKQRRIVRGDWMTPPVPALLPSSA